MEKEIKIKYILKALDNSTYESRTYSIEEIEDSYDIEEMIWDNESQCSCSLNESNAYCDCGGYLGNWDEGVEFKIHKRILV